MTQFRGRRAKFGAAFLLLVASSCGAVAAPSCAVPPELMQIPATIPRLGGALHARRPATIVVIGGASTLGAAAGAPNRAYPQRLQAALSGFYPNRSITVLNRGVPRQTAEEMLARFPTDVFAANPTLVIWEAGIVEAVRSVGADRLAAALQQGIDATRQRRIDIILVDMQFSRRANTVIDFEQYLDTVHRVGDLNGVYVFPRYAMMRYWSEQHMFNLEEVADRNRAALASDVYDCIGRKLAEAIRIAVQ